MAFFSLARIRYSRLVRREAGKDAVRPQQQQTGVSSILFSSLLLRFVLSFKDFFGYSDLGHGTCTKNGRGGRPLKIQFNLQKGSDNRSGYLCACIDVGRSPVLPERLSCGIKISNVGQSW